MRRNWFELITDQFSYKVIALVIALVLWLTILGRRDFVMTKTIEIDLLTAKGTVVAAQTADQIKVKVSGPRASLKKFMESAMNESLSVDISKAGVGIIDIDVPVSRIETPLGVKIIGVRPNVIRAEVLRGSGH